MSAVEEEFHGTERFALERRLGSGGFGVVYKVFDRRRGATVALKTLRRADEEALYRLKREFRALADISHPNLVSLYELLSEEGRWFFTMEYVQGLDFLGWSFGASPGEPTREPREDRTRTLTGEPPPYPAPAPIPGRVDFGRLRAALRQAAAGVRALHEAGHLHCDIKPSNVLVTGEGRVVLLDFGLVRESAVEASEISLTLAGTPSYMSPEQCANRPVTEATDWYSLGVMLYEALTGRVPFSGSYAEIMIEKLRSEPVPVAKAAPDAPEDLARLCEALLARDASGRPPGSEIVAMLEPASPSALAAIVRREDARPTATTLLGRDPHLAVLHAAFRGVERGRAAAVFVHGGSGMGKSSLVRRFLEDLRGRDVALALAGRCYERESVPYKAVDSLIDALSHHWKKLPAAEAEALLPRDVGALARVFPVLRRVEAVASARGRAPEAPDAHELRRRAFAALRDLIGRLAERRPIVLFIDDLQWGDLDSAALLRELLRPPDPPAVLLIAAYRTEDASGSPPISRMLAARREGLETHEVLVSELSEAEAVALARRLLPEESAGRADAIVRESAGNPFLIDELARYARGGAPEMPHDGDASPASLFSRLVATRLAALPDSARRLLEIVSVAGAPLDAAVAAEAAGLETAESEIVTLRTGHLLRRRAAGVEGEHQLEAYHDRIRETVSAMLTPERRNECHRGLAAALEARRDADPEALALHYLEGGDAARAAGYAAAAAQRAAQALDFDQAARLYALALRLEPSGVLEERRRLRLSLAEALANAGRGAEAADAYLEAVPGASAAETLELQRLAAEQMLRSGHIDRGLPLLKGVLGRINLRLMDSPHAALASLLLRRALVRLRGMRFVERDESQVSPERLIRIDTCWSVSIGLGMVDTFRSRDFQARHLLLALDTGERYRVARALATEAGFSATAGRAASARTERALRHAVALADRVNHPQALAIAQVALGLTAYLEGRWRIAWERAQNAEAILRDRCTGVAWELDTTHIYSLRALAYLGGLRELQTRLPALLAEAAARDDLFAETSLRARHLYVARLAEDRPEEGLREVREAIARWSHEAFHLQHYFALLSEMELAIYRGDAEAVRAALARDAEALARSRLRRLQVFRVELAFADGRTALCADAGDKGRLEEAERAAAVLTRESLPWANPLAALLRAGVAARRGRSEEAHERLLQAEVAFEESDMTLYAAAARRARGVLLGGDVGRALRDAADEALRAQRIVDPERFARYLAPMLA